MTNSVRQVSESDHELFYEAQLLRSHFPFLLSSRQAILDDDRWAGTSMHLGIGGIAPVGFRLSLGDMLHSWGLDLRVLDNWPDLGRVYILGFGGLSSGSMEWRGCTAQGRLVFGGNMRKWKGAELEYKRLRCGAELAPDLDVGGLMALYRQYGGAGSGTDADDCDDDYDGWDDDYNDCDDDYDEDLSEQAADLPKSLHDLLVEMGVTPEPYAPISSAPEPPPAPEPVSKPPVLLNLWPSANSRMSGGSDWGNEWPEDVDR